MEDRESAVKKYNEMKTAYGLPELSEIEEELDFELEDDASIHKTIINHIWDKISNFKSYIEGALNPQRYCCIIETKFLNPKEKEKIFNFYKIIMKQYWKTVLATYGNKEDKIKQIKESYEFYHKVKKFSNNYIKRMINGWTEKNEEKEDETYIN